MKKFGFTLAEVLITLAIIGVIAAVTLPTLNANTAMASIGPKLGKAVSVFEQANQSMLTEKSVDSLTDAGVFDGGADNYFGELTNYIRFDVTDFAYNIDTTGAGASCAPLAAWNAEGSVSAISKDGIYYQFTYAPPPGAASLRTRDSIGSLYIDINGTAEPNEVATDVFAFRVDNDGTLRPLGARGVRCGLNTWRELCPLEDDGEATDLWACAGHVFENNMKAQWR